jgi:hypothetical protein
VFTCFEVGDFGEGVSWFRLVLKLDGASYAHFVGDHSRFWVDGPAHVYELIREDIVARGNTVPANIVSLFEQSFAKPQILRPEAYDIVVFRPGTFGVDGRVLCQPASPDVYEDTNHPETGRAHLFVTRSPEFWIDLQFEDLIGVAPSGPDERTFTASA